MSKYIVTIDNPYYPAIYYCDTLEDAEFRKKVLVSEMHEKDGEHKCKVVIAEVLGIVNIRTHF